MIQIILYGIFGVLTTALNIWLYWACTRLLGLEVVASTVIAWIIAVLFAYWSNRKFVFHSQSPEIFREAVEFFVARLATGIMDVAIMYVCVDVLKFPDVWIKTFSNILVIILNYIASKIYIFTEKKS